MSNRGFLVVLLIGLFLATFSFTQEGASQRQKNQIRITLNWYELNKKVDTLFKQGRYEEAENVAKHALQFAEENFDPTDTEVAISLYYLGIIPFHLL